MRKAIIVDIDGTLADIGERRKHLEGPKKNWVAFSQGMENDKPNEWCFELCEAMWMSDYDLTIIFCTGREEKYRELTEKWIEDYGSDNFGLQKLFMRADGDYRKDAIIKKEIYEREIKDKYEVIFCVDDRQQVVDSWRELGLVCLQCAKGDF